MFPVVSTTVAIGPQQEMLKRLVRPEAIKAFLDKEAAGLVAQARFNIVSGAGMDPLTKRYGKRKDAGKTPGHGKFGSGDLLRDTGQMYDSLKGFAWIDSAGIHLGLGAEGERNQRLLDIHSSGDGNNPLRNPVVHIVMQRYEADVLRRFTAYLAGEAMGPGPAAPAMALKAA